MNEYFAWFGLPGSFVLTMGMSLYALILALCFRTPARWLCFAAMALSSVGDIFLMRFNHLWRIFPNSFEIGAAFFMLSHLVYAACFGVKIRADGRGYFNGGVVIALAIAVTCLAYFAKRCFAYGNRGAFPLAALYLAVITVNVMTVFSCAWSSWSVHPASMLAAAGVFLFLLSDLIIGLGMLTYLHTHDNLIWWLYPIGQILLITGVGK